MAEVDLVVRLHDWNIEIIILKFVLLNFINCDNFRIL